MNTHHHIVISIGSNYAAETNIPAAMRLLRDSYPTIRFSKPIENAPIDFPYPSGLFTNLTAHFYSSENREEVGRKLKGIELQLGRTYTKPFDGRVAIDLDLIVWNNTILKNVDYSRPYIQSGLQELRINIQTQLNMTKESRSETFFHNKPNNWNCAQAVQKGFQDLTGMTDEAIEEEYRPKGGGRAEGGLCGALYSANRILESKGLQPVSQEFQAHAGGITCRELKGELKFPCNNCVRLAEELVEQRLSESQTID